MKGVSRNATKRMGGDNLNHANDVLMLLNGAGINSESSIPVLLPPLIYLHIYFL